LTGGEVEYEKASSVKQDEEPLQDETASENIAMFNMGSDQSDIMMDKLDDILEEFQKQSTLLNQEFANITGKVASISSSEEPPPWAKKVMLQCAHNYRRVYISVSPFPFLRYLRGLNRFHQI
jgi:hypothetical protein